MAKVFDSIGGTDAPTVPSYPYEIEDWVERNRVYDERIREYCNEAVSRCAFDNSPEVGQIIKFSVADGFARYLILGCKRVAKLLWIKEGDGYRAHPALERGLTVSEVREAARRERALRQLFEEKLRKPQSVE